MYTPQPAIIEEIIEENGLVKTFRLALPADGQGKPQPFRFEAGQFVMLSVPHCGEAPISISSIPANPSHFDLTIRKVGSLTGAMHQMNKGDLVGVRGPYGRAFPLDDLIGQNLLLVAGGIGMAPLKGVLESCLSWKKVKKLDELAITLCYGSRTAAEINFRQQLSAWQQDGVDCRLTVDRGDMTWDGPVGLVTEQLADQQYQGEGHALVCGPAVMIKAVTSRLLELGWPAQRIITTLERQMKCGVGVCRHCHMDGKLVCKDGPVFSFDELQQLKIPEVG